MAVQAADPIARASSMLRLGLRISPATKLNCTQPSHASTQAIRATPKPDSEKPAEVGCNDVAGWPLQSKALATISRSPATFAMVNNFCTNAPALTPQKLIAVNSAMAPRPRILEVRGEIGTK